MIVVLSWFSLVSTQASRWCHAYFILPRFLQSNREITLHASQSMTHNHLLTSYVSLAMSICVFYLAIFTVSKSLSLPIPRVVLSLAPTSFSLDFYQHGSSSCISCFAWPPCIQLGSLLTSSESLNHPVLSSLLSPDLPAIGHQGLYTIHTSWDKHICTYNVI